MSSLLNFTNRSDTPKAPSLWCEDHQEGVFLWTCTSVVAFVLGFPAVVAVLWEMLQRARKKGQFTPHDIFVFNATVLDGIMLFINSLELYNFHYGKNMVFERISLVGFLFTLSGRPLFITCISMDCYLAVVHPVVYHANKSLTPRILVSAGIWIVTFLYGSILSVYIELTNIILEIIFLPLSFPIIGFCDVSVFWTLRRANPAGGAVHPKKRRAQQVIINNLVITFTSFLPPAVGVLLAQFFFFDQYGFLCLILFPLQSCMIIGSTVSPILHLNNLGKLNWLQCSLKK